jgi:hypothetical protein
MRVPPGWGLGATRIVHHRDSAGTRTGRDMPILIRLDSSDLLVHVLRTQAEMARSSPANTRLEEMVMAAKHKVTVSMQPTNARLSTAERRAASIALLSTQQAELKQEAADRRDQRAAKRAADAPTA